MGTGATYIRVASPEDAEAIRDIYAYYVEKTAITFEYDVPSVSEFKERIAGTITRYPYIVAIEDDEIAGYAYTGAFHTRAAYGWAAETTVYLKKNKKKRGLGRRLYQALEDISKAQNIINLNACIGYPNAEDAYLSKDSALFHAHMGYSTVGEFHQCGYKFGRWYNIVWMEKMIGEHPAQPRAVIPFPALDPDKLLSLGIGR